MSNVLLNGAASRYLYTLRLPPWDYFFFFVAAVFPLIALLIARRTAGFLFSFAFGLLRIGLVPTGSVPAGVDFVIIERNVFFIFEDSPLKKK